MITDRQLAELIVKHGKDFIEECTAEEVLAGFENEPEAVQFLRDFANDLWELGYDAGSKVEYM